MESSCTNNPSPLILPAYPHHKCVINRRFKGVLSYCENKSLPENGIPNLFYLFYFYLYNLDPILHIFHMFGVLFIHSAPHRELSSPLSPTGSWRTREFCCFHFSVSKVVETWALLKKRWANVWGTVKAETNELPLVSGPCGEHISPPWDPGTCPPSGQRAGRGLWEGLKRVLSHVSRGRPCDPTTAARQAPLSVGFPRQQHRSGPSSRGSSQPRDQTHVSCVSCIGRWILYHGIIWEAPGSALSIPFPHNRRKLYKEI